MGKEQAREMTKVSTIQKDPNQFSPDLFLGGAALLLGGRFLLCGATALGLFGSLGSFRSSPVRDTSLRLPLSRLDLRWWTAVGLLLRTLGIKFLAANGELQIQLFLPLDRNIRSVLAVVEWEVGHRHGLGGLRGVFEVHKAHFLIVVHSDLDDVSGTGEVLGQLRLLSTFRQASNPDGLAAALTRWGRLGFLSPLHLDLVALDDLLVHLDGLLAVFLCGEENQHIFAMAQANFLDALAMSEALLDFILAHAIKVQILDIHCAWLIVRLRWSLFGGSCLGSSLLFLLLLGLWCRWLFCCLLLGCHCVCLARKYPLLDPGE
mmetsp:Transcript_6717/g.12677  ORF Transcript_6717/g.12677 Transcript_6717/m.12677 type:complete len:319 (-) Transcript_6717:47-1003(-)